MYSFLLSQGYRFIDIPIIISDYYCSLEEEFSVITFLYSAMISSNIHNFDLNFSPRIAIAQTLPPPPLL